MKNFTNEKLITFNERQICKLVDEKDLIALSVIDFLNKHYFFDDLNKGTITHKVFSYVYLKRTEMPKWKLAYICDVSQSTLFRIRRNIIDYFNICYYEFQRNTFKIN